MSVALAETSLSLLLERLGNAGAAHLAELSGIVERVEAAVGALADPDAVSEELRAVRAEAARQVAESAESLSRERQARNTATAEAEAARAALVEAEAVAESALSRFDEATAEIESLRGETTAVKAASDQALEAARTAAAAKLNAAESERARSEGVTEQLRLELDETRRQGIERAEHLRSELQGLVASHEEELARLRAESAQATERGRAEVTEALTARHGAELDGVRARAEGEVARAEARAEGAAELAKARSGEVERLVAQVEDLRAELARARSTKAPRRRQEPPAGEE